MKEVTVFRCFVCDFQTENHREVLLHLKLQDGHMEKLGQLVAEVSERDIRALSPAICDDGNDENNEFIKAVEFCDLFYRQSGGQLATSTPVLPPLLKPFFLDVSTFKCYKCDFSTTDWGAQQKHLNLSRDSARLGSVRYAFHFRCLDCNRTFENLKEYSQHLYNDHRRSDQVNVQASAKLVDTKADPAIIDLSATYQCHLCPVSRCSLSSLHQHFKSIHSAEFFPINQITVALDLNVEKIVESLPSDQYSYRCYQCQKDFSFCIAIKKHFEEAHPDQELDLPKALHKSEEDHQFLCYLCNDKNASLSQLRQHFLLEHPSESFKSSRLHCQLYRCKTCDNFWTFDESRLQKHYRSSRHKRAARSIEISDSKEKLSLDTEEKKEDSISLDTKLIDQAEGVVPSKFVCEPCGLEYPMKCNLIRHQNSQKHSEKVKSIRDITTEVTLPNSVETVDEKEDEAKEAVNKEEQVTAVEDEVLVCEPCNYRTSHRWNFQVHLATKKHRVLCNLEDEVLEPTESSNDIEVKEDILSEGLLESSTYDDYDTSNEEYQCLPCEFKTKFRKTWESHINHRNHKDLLKDFEIEYKNAQQNSLQQKSSTKATSPGGTVQEELPTPAEDNVEDMIDIESSNGINGVELTIVFRQSSPVSKEDEFRCSKCDFQCKVEAELNAHLQNLHNSSGAEFIDDTNCNMVGSTWKCRHCPRLFSSLVSLKRHCTWKHNPDKPPQRPKTPEAGKLDNHVSSDLTVNCDQCDRKFNSPIALKRHCTWKHPIAVEEIPNEDLMQPKFPCFFCPRLFDSPMSRKRHCTWKHPELRSRMDEEEELLSLQQEFEKPMTERYIEKDNNVGVGQFSCPTCGFKGKNQKAISGHWNKKKTCRPSTNDSISEPEITEFTTADVDEQVTFDCGECSFRGASKKSLLIHISCKHRSSKAVKRSLEEGQDSAPKQAKMDDSEGYSEDEDEDAREIIDSIVQDIPVSASTLTNSDNHGYTTMTNVEDEIHLSEEEEEELLAEEDDFDEDDSEEELHLFIDDDEDQIVTKVENVVVSSAGSVVGKRTASLSSSASFSSECSNAIVPPFGGKEKEEEERRVVKEAESTTKQLYKCDHCDFSNYHQDVMIVHNLVHKKPSLTGMVSDSDQYNTVQEKTICMCCAHCQFKTKDFDQMMEHNKKEHPEPEL